MVLQFSKVLLAHPQQHRAVELGVSSHKVMLARLKLPAFTVQPVLGIVVPSVDEYFLGVPVLFLPSQVPTTFQDQDPFA